MLNAVLVRLQQGFGQSDDIGESARSWSLHSQWLTLVNCLCHRRGIVRDSPDVGHFQQLFKLRSRESVDLRVVAIDDWVVLPALSCCFSALVTET